MEHSGSSDGRIADSEVEVAGYRLPVRQGKALLPRGVALRSTVAEPRPRRTRTEEPPLRALRETSAYEPAAVARRVVDALGNNVAASLLDVAKDRPSRWASGMERPSGDSRTRLAELDALLGQLLAIFTPQQAQLWLVGEDPQLRARPVDVFLLRGSGPLVAAAQAYEQGAFA